MQNEEGENLTTIPQIGKDEKEAHEQEIKDENNTQITTTTNVEANIESPVVGEVPELTQLTLNIQETVEDVKNDGANASSCNHGNIPNIS